MLILPATLGGGHLSDQPALLRLLRLAARRGRARLSRLCRPAEPAAARRSSASALGTAILPTISRAIDRDATTRRRDVQGRAFELAHAADPARRARAGGRRRADHRARCSRAAASPPRMRRSPATSSPSSSIGLPAYVLVKVLTPGFYARKDMRTPVRDRDRDAGRQRRRQFRPDPADRHLSLAAVTAAGAWVNCPRCSTSILRRARPFPRRPAGSSAASSGSCSPALAMARRSVLLQRPLGDRLRRLGAVERLVGSARWSAPASIVYFGVAWVDRRHATGTTSRPCCSADRSTEEAN